MMSDTPFFMYEPPSIKREEDIKDKDFRKILFLRNFIVQTGKVSLKNKPKIKVPIQSVVRKPVEKKAIDFSHLLPEIRKDIHKQKKVFMPFYPKTSIQPMKRLPDLAPKKLPELKSKIIPEVIPKKTKEEIYKSEIEEFLNVGTKKEVLNPNIKEREGNLHYHIPKDVSFKKYGIIDPLIADEKIDKINFFDKEITIDSGDSENVPTGLRFKNIGEVNDLIKKLAKEAGIKISEKEPMLNSTLPEGFRVYANYGTDYVPPTFSLIRKK